MKTRTITDKINDSLKARVDSDEDSDNADFDNRAQVVDFDHDEYDVPDVKSRSSDFRKRNVKLLSEQSNKYKGRIASRKELDSEDDSDEEETIGHNEEGSSSEEEAGVNSSEAEVDGDDDGDEQQLSDSFENDEDSNEESDDNSTLEAEEDAVAEGKRQEKEIRKGVSVQNQLRIWERLLELRIRTQKLLMTSNELPLPINKLDYASDTAKETQEKTCLLLKNLFALKATLTSQFSELRTHMKRPLQDSSILNKYESGEPPLKRIADELEEQHSRMRPYRNAVLLKWDDRTKLLAPGAGTKKKVHEEFDVVRKIENALLNREILIAKSRVIPNSESNTEEEPTEDQTEKGNANVYNDNDFYHQQLRELIEYKSNSSSNVAEITKQVVELQKLRQKMKKKVDTRASKGRKIRYNVHNKLVNFMAPDDTTTVNWPDESKDELYKSLFA